MRLYGLPVIYAALLTTCAFALGAPAATAAAEPALAASPAPSASPGGPLPLIGHVRAVTPFCRTIVDDASSLADDELSDITTATEALRILTYAPFDRDVFIERRGARALETLAGRLMASRKGKAQVFVAGLRKSARGDADEAPRPDLARFAAALDGAHSESSAVAHELARALSVLDADGLQFGMYMPDYQLVSDPRFVRANEQVPFPVDATLERLPPDRLVDNGPLHAYARSIALEVAMSLERLEGSIAEARALIPTAFAGCVDEDGAPDPAASPAP